MNIILMHMDIYCVEFVLLHMKISNHVGVYVKFPFDLQNFYYILVFFFVQFLCRDLNFMLTTRVKVCKGAS
jgi:hypothetical protein